nr:threonine/serine dehydratase [Kibdelosporangium sp. MJ126-NF4]CEL13335.1 Threonine dehydratase, catabolic [Kibdelosporangium sp. MJ126-NF4]CTQ99026.1 Threonine dehydratase, catabolic (EC 4.3.1.19) [Kibdelosporangium sp. MJ126-NF4]
MPRLSGLDVLGAARRLTGRVRRTPVLTSERLDDILGARIFLKAEHRQLTGSFKLRGVLNRMLQFGPSELDRGVIAGSSGNHGRALVTAAAELGTSAVVVLPSDAPEHKRAAIEAAGATVVPFDRVATDRDALVASLVLRHRRVPVPSSDDLAVIAGNGSAAVELLEDVGCLDCLVIPVGGGGVAAGTGLVARSLYPGVQVFGAEPAGADDTARSLRAGAPVPIDMPTTIADGLRHPRPGTLTFPIIRRTLRDVLVVSDVDIVAAMRLVRDCVGDIVEPSGACGLAAVVAHPRIFTGRRVGILISGGNVEPALFDQLVGGPAPAPS